jgi:hypothetical protein
MSLDRRRPIANNSPVPRIGLDVFVLFLAVALSFAIIPGHGLWGWAAMVGICIALGTLIGQFGRRYPRLIYGSRARHSRRRSH